MTILDRILHDEEPRLPAHEFFAAMTLYKAGHLTKAQLKTEFEGNQFWGPMTTQETTDLDEFFSGLDASLTLDEIHSTIILGQQNLLTKTQVKSFLGLTAG